MIKITIEHVEQQSYVTTENFVMKRTPTEITEPKSYGSGRETQFIEENEPREVTKFREVRTTLIEQEIRDDAEFDLKAVIKAINKL